LRADEINDPHDVVDKNAEGGFSLDVGKASGEEPAASRHPLDGSERVFSGASPLPHEVWIGFDAGIHALKRVLVKVSLNEAALDAGASRLERATRTIVGHIQDALLSSEDLLAHQPAGQRKLSVCGS
jgi:hypothetical protein